MLVSGIYVAPPLTLPPLISLLTCSYPLASLPVFMLTTSLTPLLAHRLRPRGDHLRVVPLVLRVAGKVLGPRHGVEPLDVLDRALVAQRK